MKKNKSMQKELLMEAHYYLVDVEYNHKKEEANYLNKQFVTKYITLHTIDKENLLHLSDSKFKNYIKALLKNLFLSFSESFKEKIDYIESDISYRLRKLKEE